MQTTGGFGFTAIVVACAQQTTNPITGATYTCPWTGTVNAFDGKISQTLSNGVPSGVTMSIVCPGCNQPIVNKPALTFSLLQLQTVHNLGHFCPQAYTPVLVATLAGQVYTNGGAP